MNGKTHLAAGVIAGIGIMSLQNRYGIVLGEPIGMVVVGSGIGSLLPDIDIKNSMLGRFIPLWLFVEHRTITHSLMFVAVITGMAAIVQLNLSIVVGLCVGLITHLLLDSITPMGLPYLLYPIKRRGY